MSPRCHGGHHDLGPRRTGCLVVLRGWLFGCEVAVGPALTTPPSMTAYHRDTTRTDLPLLLIQAIATVRLERLISEDTITAGARAWFFKKHPTHLQQIPGEKRPRGRRWKPLESPSGDTLGWYRQPRIGPAVLGVLGCPYWCLSIWAGGLILIAERCGSVGRFLVRTLVLSQLAAISYNVAVPLPSRSTARRAA